jgi:hypothetical protein
MVPHRSSRAGPAVAAGPWLLVVDGDKDDTYAARRQEDGRLGAWQTLKDWGFGGVHHGSGVVLMGDHAYSVGLSGYTRRIGVKGDGVSKWEFPVPGDKIDPMNDRPREMVWTTAASVTMGDRTFLYCVGGFEYRQGKPCDLECVYVAESTKPGEVGPWKAVTSLPYPVMSTRAAGHGDRLYVLGGTSKFLPPLKRHDEVLSARVKEDGTLGPWQQVGRLPQPMEGMATFVFEDCLYLLGGEAGSPLATCWRARFGKTGALGPWQPQPPLPKPAAHCPCAVIERTVYLVGEPGAGGSAPVFISRL